MFFSFTVNVCHAVHVPVLNKMTDLRTAIVIELYIKMNILFQVKILKLSNHTYMNFLFYVNVKALVGCILYLWTY